MDEVPPPPADIDHYVAVNVRELREHRGLSQGELALRMIEQGFEFTQATISKIEAGHRSVKVSEVLALGRALGLGAVLPLAERPEISERRVELEVADREARKAYEAVKAAAATYLRAQRDLSLTLREARDAGLGVDAEYYRWGWLATPAEQAVIEARVQLDEHDRITGQQISRVSAVLETLREHGLELPGPEAWDPPPPVGRSRETPRLWEFDHPFYGDSGEDEDLSSFAELRECLAGHPHDGSTVIYRWDWRLPNTTYPSPGECEELIIFGLFPRVSRTWSLRCPISKDQEDEVREWLQGPDVLGQLAPLWAPVLDAAASKAGRAGSAVSDTAPQGDW